MASCRLGRPLSDFVGVSAKGAGNAWRDSLIRRRLPLTEEAELRGDGVVSHSVAHVVGQPF